MNQFSIMNKILLLLSALKYLTSVDGQFCQPNVQNVGNLNTIE